MDNVNHGILLVGASNAPTKLEVKLGQLKSGVLSCLGAKAEVNITEEDFTSYLVNVLAYDENTTISCIKSQLYQKISRLISKQCDTLEKLNAFRLLLKGIQEGVNANGYYNRWFGRIDSDNELQKCYDGGIDTGFFNNILSHWSYKDLRIELAIICSHQNGGGFSSVPTTKYSLTGGTNYTTIAGNLRDLLQKTPTEIKLMIPTQGYQPNNYKKTYNYNPAVRKEINKDGNVVYKLGEITYCTRGKAASMKKSVGSGSVGTVITQDLPYKKLTAVKRFENDGTYHSGIVDYFNRMIYEVNRLGMEGRVIPPLFLKDNDKKIIGQISYKSVAPLIMKAQRACDCIEDIPVSAFKQAASDIWTLQKLGFRMIDANLENYLYVKERNLLIRIDLDNDMKIHEGVLEENENVLIAPKCKNGAKLQAQNFWEFIRKIAEARMVKLEIDGYDRSLSGIISLEYIGIFAVGHEVLIEDLVIFAKTRNYSELFFDESVI